MEVRLAPLRRVLDRILIALLFFLLGIGANGLLGWGMNCPRISCDLRRCTSHDELRGDTIGRWALPENPVDASTREQDGAAIEISVGNVGADATAQSSLEHGSLHEVVKSMQSNYYELWLGTWPDAIDWTAAVTGTLLSASLSSLARAWEHRARTLETAPADAKKLSDALDAENELNTYFAHTVGFYFGEDAFGIRLQAYDDMLWVVLGWLEGIKSIETRSTARQSRLARAGGTSAAESDAWFGEQFSPVFAHRSRIFYDLAREGYDYSLCGGGMLWDPKSVPYKNAVTNELFIAASAGMYLYFPGDPNTSPMVTPFEPYFDAASSGLGAWYSKESVAATEAGPYDLAYLRRAVEGYKWLKNSNMTNEQGLYVDGFHIKDYGVNGTIGSGKCDVRNEMVYTYNQGVLLSGLRGLWEGTGERAYLEDGHRLVRNVINATGWGLSEQSPFSSSTEDHWEWRGLGRAGILEELCDASGTCNQDGQMFKGIFFHHLTLFCEPLPLLAKKPGKTFAADSETAFLHRSSCAEYTPWVTRNAKAALNTRNERGRFGMWWTLGLEKDANEDTRGFHPFAIETVDDRVPDGAIDRMVEHEPHASAIEQRTEYLRQTGQGPQSARGLTGPDDPNDRHRGRTVETQGGGLAVVRAMWEFSRLSQKVL